MKFYFPTLALTGTLIFALGSSAQAQSLQGQDVRVDYLFDNQSTVYQTLGTQTVTASGVTYNSFGQTDYLVTPAQIKITDVFGSDILFTPATFNGISATESGSTPSMITGVSIDAATNLTGFDTSRISFNSTQVFINLQSLTTTPETTVLLNLQFGRTPTTPEPGSMALLVGMGISGAGFLVRRKQSRKSA